jgi:hypothetical protein
MRLHSYTCAASGLPIRCSLSSMSPIMYDVVVMDRSGVLAFGEYDGYGNVGDSFSTHDIGDVSDLKFVLRWFYNSQRWADLRTSYDDPLQGIAGASEFIDAIYEAKLTYAGEFDAHQYRSRLTEFYELMNAFYVEYLQQTIGISAKQYRQLIQLLENFEIGADRLVFEEEFNNIIPRLNTGNRATDPGICIKLLCIQERTFQRHVIKEIITAWKENTSVKNLDVHEILALENIKTNFKSR